MASPVINMNARVALALGWTQLSNHFSWSGVKGLSPTAGKIISAPDWSHDLNACRELEDGLSLEEKHVYIAELSLLIGCEYWYVFMMVHATAAQKCEAWLKVKEVG